VIVVDDVHTQQALSTAELLLEQGKRVEVISPLFYVGQDIGVTSIAPLYARLQPKASSSRPAPSCAPWRARPWSSRTSIRAWTAYRVRRHGRGGGRSRSTDSLYRALKGQSPSSTRGRLRRSAGVHQAISTARGWREI